MKTVFLRLLEVEVGEKPDALRLAARVRKTQSRFEVDATTFSTIPKSPFAYWVRDSVRHVFANNPPLKLQYLAVRGAYTTNDFKYYRLTWEATPSRIGTSRADTHGGRPFAALVKGGAFSPYYSDPHLLVFWSEDGREAKTFLSAYRERKGWGTDWSACLNGYDHYYRPGLTWPRRTQGGLSLRVMPRGCIFADKGPAAFVDGDYPTDLLALAAVTNSAPFGALVELQMAFGSYEVGVIQRTPIPHLESDSRDTLSALARRAWSFKRTLDTRTETSHAFALPALLRVDVGALVERFDAWSGRVAATEAELANIQAEIDDRCYALYAISDEDRASIERGFGAPTTDAEPSDDEDAADADTEVDAGPMVASLLSWSVGVAFGRFDVRLATGQREQPPDPEPFDPLLPCSPGMLTGDDGLPLDEPPPGYPIVFPSDGVLVDDPGHPRDPVAAARHVFDVVFSADADARWQEAAELVLARRNDLRDWFSRTFFEQHLKRYSKSRRKAPIYWQLATPSGSYSVWLYAHRVTRDTFFKVLNDYVVPKLQHEEAKLTALVQALGPSPSSSQGKAIDKQEAFVEELRAFREEVARIAPLWNPDLDDGIVLVKAPLWRLVPTHKAWQKELRTNWEELQEGKYDWAHLAMHHWPERVVPKCAEDRSLAIAHDLEEVFWSEDDAGKWHPREVDAATVEALVAERKSPSVKDALRSLLDAPAPTGTKKGRRKK